MLIDVILDRKDGCFHSPEELKDEVTESIFANDCYKDVQTTAVKSGDESKVKTALKDYLKDNGYSCTEYNDYVDSVD